jgi:coenzyme F420-dependent glucose-6-phosphate dehydrogenase
MKVYWFLGHEQFQPEVLVEQAQAAEAAGFDGVAVSEHFHPWVDDYGAGGFAWSTLGAIAVATRQLELLSYVVTPLWRYHPAVVAQAAATVDRLSGGRFALGVGTGRNEGALGFPYPGYSERSARMSEALDIMRRLLDGARLDYDGRYYRTSGAQLAAGRTDGLIISVKDVDDAIDRVVEPARKEADSEGRGQPAVVASRWTVRGADDDEAWRALEPWRGLRAPNRDQQTDPAQLRRAADELPREEVLRQYRRVQGAGDYVEAYGEIVKRLHPNILVIQTTSVDQVGTIEMVGREVVPELRKTARA